MYDYYKLGYLLLSDTLFNVVEGLPNQYANLTAFTNLSNNYYSFQQMILLIYQI
jgi:hypothetical protein